MEELNELRTIRAVESAVRLQLKTVSQVSEVDMDDEQVQAEVRKLEHELEMFMIEKLMGFYKRTTHTVCDVYVNMINVTNLSDPRPVFIVGGVLCTLAGEIEPINQEINDAND